MEGERSITNQPGGGVNCLFKGAKLAKLAKQLGLGDIFCLASGAMISSGLFVLPALAYNKAGASVILAYLLASLLVIPTVFSKAELATAMPRAGGTYFYIERSLGPIWGLFGGLASWFSVGLKSAFALVGMAIFIRVGIEKLLHTALADGHMRIIAVACCGGFMLLNIMGVKRSSRFQVWLVAALLVILAGFVVFGAKSIDASRYQPFFPDAGFLAVLATAGMVFVSFGGLTKVALIAEEVKNPGRNLALGMLLSWFVVSVFYVATVAVAVGVTQGAELRGSLTPVSLAAGKFAGPAGFLVLAIAAVVAFVTTANAGIMTASRCPMAMSRDQLLPAELAKVNDKFKTPHVSIMLTALFMITAIAFLDIEKLVKTASTLKIILFILTNASVIIMRESKIQSYQPRFKSPLYPYVQIFAILFYILLIIDMGAVPLLITACFIVLSVGWFGLYVRRRVSRQSALMHVVERVTSKELKTVTLENELRDILLERDDIVEDRFDRLIKRCRILDVKGRAGADEVFKDISGILAARLGAEEDTLFEKFRQREVEGGTVIGAGLAIPHIIVEGTQRFDMVLVRAVDGIDFPGTAEPVHAMFTLAGSRDERNYHLRALAAIAQIVQGKDFEEQWLAARDAEALRNLILLSARKRQT